MDEKIVKSFVDNVKVMRNAQRQYFATKDRRHFHTAKEYERKVDHDLKNYFSKQEQLPF